MRATTGHCGTSAKRADIGAKRADIGAKRAHRRAGDAAGSKRHTNGIAATSVVIIEHGVCDAARDKRR